MPLNPLLEERHGAKRHAGSALPQPPRGHAGRGWAESVPRFPLSRLSGRALRVALAAVMLLLLPFHGALAQAPRHEAPAALRFFLTEAPPASVLSELPTFARRAFVAKVRLLSIRSTHPPEWPPGEDVPDLPYGLRAEIEVTEAIAGAYVWRRRQRVEFGSTRPSPTRVLYPLRRNIEYFIVSFVGEDGIRTLLGFPASREELEAWRRELNQYAR